MHLLAISLRLSAIANHHCFSWLHRACSICTALCLSPKPFTDCSNEFCYQATDTSNVMTVTHYFINYSRSNLIETLQN